MSGAQNQPHKTNQELNKISQNEFLSISFITCYQCLFVVDWIHGNLVVELKKVVVFIRKSRSSDVTEMVRIVLVSSDCYTFIGIQIPDYDLKGFFYHLPGVNRTQSYKQKSYRFIKLYVSSFILKRLSLSRSVNTKLRRLSCDSHQTSKITFPCVHMWLIDSAKVTKRKL